METNTYIKPGEFISKYTPTFVCVGSACRGLWGMEMSYIPDAQFLHRKNHYASIWVTDGRDGFLDEISTPPTRTDYIELYSPNTPLPPDFNRLLVSPKAIHNLETTFNRLNDDSKKTPYQYIDVVFRSMKLVNSNGEEMQIPMSVFTIFIVDNVLYIGPQYVSFLHSVMNAKWISGKREELFRIWYEQLDTLYELFYQYGINSEQKMEINPFVTISMPEEHTMGSTISTFMKAFQDAYAVTFEKRVCYESIFHSPQFLAITDARCFEANIPFRCRDTSYREGVGQLLDPLVITARNAIRSAWEQNWQYARSQTTPEQREIYKENTNYILAQLGATRLL